jgi:16S rRNA (guanine527-N7)-methyltransferase
MDGVDPRIAALCGQHTETMMRYVELLLDRALPFGFIGPSEHDKLWPRHVANCASLVSLLPPSASVCDVGSGAGLPGLVLAILRPDLSVTCIDSIGKRCTFLLEVSTELHLDNVKVVNTRSEQFRGEQFQFVTARAVAALPTLIQQTVHLLVPGGSLLALKGATALEEVEKAGADHAITAHGACRLQVLSDCYAQPVNVVTYQRNF